MSSGEAEAEGAGVGCARGAQANYAAHDTIATGWLNELDVVSTGGGTIFARNSNGNLYWYRDLAQNGTVNFDVASGSVVNNASSTAPKDGQGTVVTT